MAFIKLFDFKNSTGLLKKEYEKLSEKLGYALFDENYLILNANP